VIVNEEELKALAQLGRAIWSEAEIAERATAETLMAVSLQDPEPERALERAASVLFERASREGTAFLTQRNFSQIGLPFYRLDHQNRFLLSALHSGRWSYDRISRVIGLEREKVEELAWSARLELSSLGSVGTGRAAPYPAGAKTAGQNCPEYDPRRPWTQRFLDEEIPGGGERLFLQNHLLNCASCKQVLVRCREIFFSVEALMPRLADDPSTIRNLRNVFQKARAMKYPSELSFRQGLQTFLGRREVQVALAGLALLVFFKVFN